MHVETRPWSRFWVYNFHHCPTVSLPRSSIKLLVAGHHLARKLHLHSKNFIIINCSVTIMNYTQMDKLPWLDCKLQYTQWWLQLSVGARDGILHSSLEKLHKRFEETQEHSEPPSQVVDSGISWLCIRHLLSVVLANICVMFSCLCAGALFVLRSRGPALVCCMRRCQTDYHD